MHNLNTKKLKSNLNTINIIYKIISIIYYIKKNSSTFNQPFFIEIK